MARNSREDRVVVMNPRTGRGDGSISRLYYEQVRQAILGALDDAPDRVRFRELAALVEGRTNPSLWVDHSVGWYTTTVKLDLEARGEIEVQRGRPPQVVRAVSRAAG